LDVRKMKAVKWLCFSDEHLGDALIYSNTLLRRFLLADKVASAFMFMQQDIRRDELLQNLIEGADMMQDSEDGGNTDSIHGARVEQARFEHLAFQSYLEAFRVVEEWREVVAGTEARTSLVDDQQVDKTQLNATEAAIATSMERRELVQEKRKSGHLVVTAAAEAQKALIAVLEHPGGWLWTEDEEIVQGEGDESDMARRGELQALRVKLLPDVVMLYHEVCTETARWMSISLDDGVARVGGTTDSVFKLLDESKRMASSPLSPLYWTHQALELAGLVATDTYGISSSCGVTDLEDLMSKMAEATIASMLYSNQREKHVSQLS
jgi:hypothetical protein